MKRPIEPALQPAFDRIDDVGMAIDGTLRAITGRPCGFVLVVLASEPGHASLLVTNTAQETAGKALADFLDAVAKGDVQPPEQLTL